MLPALFHGFNHHVKLEAKLVLTQFWLEPLDPQ